MLRLLKRISSVTAALATVASAAAAQQSGTISGRVLTEAGTPLASASVSITSLGVGAYTNDRGAYTITIPAARLTGQTATLTARRVGYSPKSVTVTLSANASISQDFTLTQNANTLTGVVVTALGIAKEKSQLGTAQQQLSSTELNTTHDPNVLNQLQGKVSGVNITSGGTQGGTTHIVIRGSNSIKGNNEPLFIVDGVAVSNDNPLQASPGGGGLAGGGRDFGSAISDINPDDIATLTVLKGPNAAALYGSRASNGVIVITTKHGEASNGKISTQLTSSYTWDTPSVLPTYQNSYGQGAGGEFAYKDGQGGGVQDGNDQSYGPRLNGQLIPQFDSPVVNGVRQATPFIAHPNNVYSFFNTGHTLDNNIAFSGGTDKATGRLSVGMQNVAGIIPENTMQKFTGSLNGTLAVSDRLSTSASVQYSNDGARNRPGVGYNTGILEQFVWFGRQVNLPELKNQFYNADGSLYNWNSNFHNNPYWIQSENPEQDDRDHVIGSVSANYKVADWLNAQFRSGSSIARFNTQQDFAQGNLNFGDQSYFGALQLYNYRNNENNTELLFTADKKVGSRLQLNGTFGANKRYITTHNARTSTNGLAVPGTYNISNAAITPVNTQYDDRKQVNSGYGSGSFTWDEWWTVEVTGRNDWSSTLPKGNNSYFYPSINTSFVLTNAIPALQSRFLSYAKVRGSLAQVGSDADPYQLLTTYNGQTTKFGSLPQFSLSDNIANSTLKPEITKSGEVGMELGFFGDRASLDMTYYDKATTNQIIQLSVSPASGFNTTSVNAGKIQNKGFEALLTITPIKTASGDFTWNTTLNYSQNRSKVVSLYPGLQTQVLGRQWSANTEARVGYAYGALYGFPFKRDSSGNLLLNGGLPQQGALRVLGTIEPKYIAGWSNEFRFKRLSASVLLDIHRGGNIFSITNMFGQYSGVLKETMNGRQVDWDKPGLVVKGIDQKTGKVNTDTVTAEQYYQSLFQLHEPFIYDDSYIKLRELRVGLDLPATMAARLHASAVNVSFVGRNLWMHTKVPNIDPEFTYNTGNFQGMEFGELPNTKSLGLNLRITP
jgi:TonB-linked SusC/RagA family outer membrane protein